MRRFIPVVFLAMLAVHGYLIANIVDLVLRGDVLVAIDGRAPAGLSRRRLEEVRAAVARHAPQVPVRDLGLLSHSATAAAEW